MSEYTGFGNNAYDADAEGEESTFNENFYNQNNPTKLSKELGGYLMQRFNAATNNAIANVFSIHKNGHSEMKVSKMPESHHIQGTNEPPRGFEIRAEPEGMRHSREGVYSIYSGGGN